MNSKQASTCPCMTCQHGRHRAELIGVIDAELTRRAQARAQAWIDANKRDDLSARVIGTSRLDVTL